MSEPLNIKGYEQNWIQKNISFKPFVDISKDRRSPLEKVADGVNKRYRDELKKIVLKEEGVEDKVLFDRLIDLREKVCEARLQVAKTSNKSLIRSGALKWEAELWYTQIAKNTVNGKHKDATVLKAVTRSIAAEAFDLNAETDFAKVDYRAESKILNFSQLNDNHIPSIS